MGIHIARLIWTLTAMTGFAVDAQTPAGNASSGAGAAPSQSAGPAGPNWIKDPMTGCAVFNLDPLPNESIQWSGACVGGYAQGRGMLKWQDGTGGNVNYERGKLSGNFAYAWKSGFHYSGSWADGKRHGKGVLSWPNGDRYEGDWVAGRRTGRGALTPVSGESQDGIWLDDRFVK